MSACPIWQEHVPAELFNVLEFEHLVQKVEFVHPEHAAGHAKQLLEVDY